MSSIHLFTESLDGTREIDLLPLATLKIYYLDYMVKIFGVVVGEEPFVIKLCEFK